MATRTKIAAMVGMLAEAYARQTTSAMLEAYFIGLSDLPDGSIDCAGSAALRNGGKFMPTPSELRALAVTGGTSLEACADRAWMSFTMARRRVGSSRGVNFRDALINATVRLLGGWCAVCYRSDDDLNIWFRKDFYATYARLLLGSPPFDQHRALSGESKGMVFVNCDYQPVVESSRELLERPANVPQIKFKKVN